MAGRRPKTCAVYPCDVKKPKYVSATLLATQNHAGDYTYLVLNDRVSVGMPMDIPLCKSHHDDIELGMEFEVTLVA